jgi:hypothetical protein
MRLALNIRERKTFKRPVKQSFCLIVGLLWMGLAVPLRAAVIFDNSAHDLVTRFAPGTNEVGDEILLGSPERYLTNFAFEFWGTNSANPEAFAGEVEARVRFYENNGDSFNGFPSPGDQFYDSDWFSIAPTPRSTEVFTLGSDFAWTGLFLPVTSNMTWSVQFKGMGATDSVGVDMYSPPVVGQDYPDCWMNTNGTGMLLTNNSGVHIDFAAKMEASAQPTVNPNPPVLTNTVSGSNLLLSWATDHIGWKLQVQTNSINVGLSNNWHTIPESGTVNTWTLPIDKANGCVFSRLIYP